MQKELEIRNELTIVGNKIFYTSEQDILLWPGQTIILKNNIELRYIYISNQFGVVLTNDLLEANIFLIQNLFCYVYDKYLILRLANLNYNEAPIKLKNGDCLGKIFTFN